MKYSIYIVASLVALFSFTSCEDFLTDEPESVLGQEGFFTTPIRIDEGILGCYAGLKRIADVEWMFTELRSDNTCVSAVSSSSSTRQILTDFAHFEVLPSDVTTTDYWYNTFQNISNINSILPSVLDNTYITVEADRAQYEAELRFLRAFHYFKLVNLFGDMFKITDVIGPLDAKTYPRSPVSEIYDEIIIPDLKIAVANAPEEYSSSQLGRVTKWAAKSLLAKAYMQLGGVENLALAEKELIDVLAAPQHGLEDDFAKVFDTENEMNKEIIFAIRYLGGNNGNGSRFWNDFAPQYSDLLAAGTPEGNNNPTFELAGLLTDDMAINDSVDEPERTAASFDIYYVTPVRSALYIKKFVDTKITVKENAENDWIEIRYADIMLLYAEVLAQSSSPDLARAEINKVRDRSGLNPINTVFSSTTMALDSVYAERRLELAFENQRFFDLLRMNKTYNDPNKAMNIIRKHTFVTDWFLYSTFDPIPVPNESNYTNDHLLLPIPQYEIDANTEMAITQNPGY